MQVHIKLVIVANFIYQSMHECIDASNTSIYVIAIIYSLNIIRQMIQF